MPEALYSMEVWKYGSVEMNGDFTFLFYSHCMRFLKFSPILESN